MIRKTLCLLLSVVMLCTGGTTVSAMNIHKTDIVTKNYKYNSLKQLKKAIKNACEDDSISMPEHYELNMNTSPEVKEQYFLREIDRISKLNIDLSVSSDQPHKTIDLGNGTKIDIKMDDFAEVTELSLGDKIKSLFITDVYAGYDQSVVTKEYGKRYCSYTCVIGLIVGAGTIHAENHYKLSKNGITERYGTAAVTGCISFGGSLSVDDGVITDKVAKKPGKSNTNMYFKYHASSSNLGINFDQDGFIKSKLVYESIDTKEKKIKLKQIWTC